MYNLDLNNLLCVIDQIDRYFILKSISNSDIIISEKYNYHYFDGQILKKYVVMMNNENKLIKIKSIDKNKCSNDKFTYIKIMTITIQLYNQGIKIISNCDELLFYYTNIYKCVNELHLIYNYIIKYATNVFIKFNKINTEYNIKFDTKSNYMNVISLVYYNCCFIPKITDVFDITIIFYTNYIAVKKKCCNYDINIIFNNNIDELLQDNTFNPYRKYLFKNIKCFLCNLYNKRNKH